MIQALELALVSYTPFNLQIIVILGNNKSTKTHFDNELIVLKFCGKIDILAPYHFQSVEGYLWPN